MDAPTAFGLPWGVGLTPWSVWKYFNAYRLGQSEAKKDIAAGILAIEEYGFGAGSSPGTELLCERYQVEIRPIAQCLVNERILGHAAGYNRVSEREIDRRVGSDRVRATREEGNRLAVEHWERQERYSKDLANRLSSFSSDSKIGLESLQVWADGRRSEIGAEAEQELGQFLRAVERFIAEVISLDAAAFELHVSARLTPTEPPKFESSASPGSGTAYEKIYKGLPNLPLPQWERGRLTVGLHFKVRETH